mmetsp:Transcript_58146/g.79263  ORF Transcript_58146/g.79263 Transcript_58146/m.79263 type:complete len:82 (+) Transcript_58146:3-248(+)
MGDLCAQCVPTSRVLNALNRHQMATFLIANLLTGLVNLTLDTLHTTGVKARAILCAYLYVVLAAAYLLDRRKTATSSERGD